MAALALILARGGSKRVPRKNVRPLAGLPMVAWPVRAACASGLFSRVLISTDDAEIAAAAVAHGAERPFVRPAHLADEHTGTMAVLTHALHALQEQGPLPPDINELCLLYGTSCFVNTDLLRQGQELLRQPGTERVFAATAYPHPIERAFRINAQGFALREKPSFALTRTQDLPPAYYDLGLCYWYRLHRSPDHRAAVPPENYEVSTRRALLVPRLRAVDVDTEEDFALAEILAQNFSMKV